MKIRFYSDIHLEFGNFRPNPPVDPNTVLVLAGDIGVKLSALPFIEKQSQYYRAIIYVMGNHEFYNANMNTVIRKWSEVSHIPNLYFLDDGEVTIDGIRFLGSTLWTDMNNDDWAIKHFTKLRMNDYKCITVGKDCYSVKNKKYLSPELTVALHKRSLAYLTTKLEDSTIPTVVVTHHAPTALGVDTDRYGVSDLNYGYYTPLEHLMEKPHLTHWIFGHTHKSLDFDIFGTRVLSNPRGYIGHDLNKNFNPTMEIVV